jgi:hypothetical protein
MRENFDYVTMDNYAKDMAESASHAAGIIHELKNRKRDAERLLIAAVLAAGGKITVHNRDLDAAPTGHFRIERNVADNTLILTAAR